MSVLKRIAFLQGLKRQHVISLLGIILTATKTFMFDKILTSMSLKDSFLLAGRGGVSLKRVVGSNNENKIIVKNCVTTLRRGE